MRCAEPVLDFLYPPRCLVCDAPIVAADVLCGFCMADLHAVPATREEALIALSSLTYRADVSTMYVGFEFEPGTGIAESIHSMKYRGLHRVAFWLGRILGERCHGSPLLDGEPVLTPVPLHRVKRIERGYNQAEMISRGFSHETGLLVCGAALRRERYTQSQAAMRLDQKARRTNTLDAFTVNYDALPLLRKRGVVLVDDLITTGSTMSDCAMVLREHGVSDIRLLAVARPPR